MSESCRTALPIAGVSSAWLRWDALCRGPGGRARLGARPVGPGRAVEPCHPLAESKRFSSLTNGILVTHNSGHARDRAPRATQMKPRAIVWDLFGDHLRYIDGGQVQMRALAELLAVFEVGDSTSRVVLSRMRREGWFTTYRDGRQTS